MSGLSSFRYFAREAIRDLWDRRSVTLLSMATISSSLYLVGLFLLVARGVEPLLGRWGDELSVSVFLGEGTSAQQTDAIRKGIAASDAVRSFEYLDRAGALARFRREFPDLADLPGLLEDNPFPASFEIRLRPGSGSPEQVAAFAASFRHLPGVEDVRFDAVWLQRLRSLLRVAWLAGAAVGTVLLGAAVLTISAVVRMGVYERRDEIEILRLVGANPGFIRAPFLIEGAFQGLAGALAALCGISATYLLASRSAIPLSVPLLRELLGSFIGPLDAAFLVATGSVLGLAGSAIAGVRE